MTEPSIHPPPGARLMFAAHHSRHHHSKSNSLSSNSPSPTHLRGGGAPAAKQPTDDFIAHLSPLTALDSFRAPTGPLKACMDTATPSEKTFAIRAAVASKHIYEWLTELQQWSWASKGGLGFQTPYSKRKLSLRGRSGSILAPGDAEQHSATKPEETYIGSLLESDLTRYETRITQIQAELDKLQIEEIKSHVLHNHIMPLSRPGTPASPSLDRRYALSALASYTRMDDMTAVITATVVQALPNLARLMRLMNSWGVRLVVLRRVPAWLGDVEAAEGAIATGWESLLRPGEGQGKPHAENSAPTLSKHEFEVMRLVLERKVTQAAAGLDYMLDNLEGRDDTLPDEWLDRMEKVERGYAEWAAGCEKALREAEAAAAEREEKQRRGALEHALREDSSAEEELDNGDDDTIRVPLNSAGLVISVEHADEDPERPLASVEEADDDGEIEPPVEDAPPSRATRSSPHTPPRQSSRSVSLPLGAVPEHPEDEEDPDDEEPPLPTPSTTTSAYGGQLGSPIVLGQLNGDGNDHMQRQISAILQALPAKIKLSSSSSSSSTTTPTSAPTKPISHLNPPDLQLPHLKPKPTPSAASTRSRSTLSSRDTLSSRASSRGGPTPAFMLAPVSRTRNSTSSSNNSPSSDIKMYHLSRANGEAPIKLFIRCVGEHGERVMVRVGGGWADLGEYLKEYAIHHGRRSNHGGESRLEVRDLPSRAASSMSNHGGGHVGGGGQQRLTSVSPRPSPPSRPVSAMATSPLFVKKKRAVSGASLHHREEELLGPRLPRTPPVTYNSPRAPIEPPSSSTSTTSDSGSTGRSRSSSHLSWTEGESDGPGPGIGGVFTLGMAGPRSSRKEIPQESLEWVESIKEKVRAASGSHPPAAAAAAEGPGKFGDIGKVGGTKRVFRKAT